ncbi:hypothetical protein V492_07559 [Pseudogymnoascus sp. VKM F-4246]|nr:hypothetical protein V492_07559 [Pseudogymnoascus sp. VKM F-4246]
MEYHGLPNEVLDRICYYLCYHCQNHGIFPNSDIKENRADKVALSRLCRASKHLNAVAQPILFHYYAAGNLPRSSNTELTRGRQFFGDEDDKLHLFMRTLIARPDLAACIRSLQLQTSNINARYTPEILNRFAQTSRDLGLAIPARLHSEITPYRTLATRYRRNVHRWLQALSIALSPLLEMLHHVLEDVTPYDYLEDSGIELPALKTVALRGAYADYNLQDARPLMAVAPNLDTLYALDCGDPVENQSWLSLGGVRKIVLQGLAPAHLAEVLSGCHSLQDLEYYLFGWPDSESLARALAPVSEGLRRLCITRLPMLEKYYRDLLPGGDGMVMPSLRSFPNLEILVIDQVFIYSKHSVSTDTGLLASFLPPSIVSVHITYVHKTTNADLLDLAAAASSSFPNLRNITIGFVDVALARAIDMEQLPMIVAAFAESGVHLTWREDFVRPYLYTAIPGGASGMTVAHKNIVPGIQTSTTVVHVPAVACGANGNCHWDGKPG